MHVPDRSTRRRFLQTSAGLAAMSLARVTPVSAAPLPQDVPCDERPNHCGTWEEMAWHIDTEVLPIPDGNPVPLTALSAGNNGGFEAFRAPYPPVPAWNPPGRKRVGIQAGHWRFNESPDELANNRSNPGTSGGGKAEWQVNLEIAEKVVELLRANGVLADLLDGTTPVRYRAHAFLSLHCDGDISGQLRGYKAASAVFSATPAADKLLVDSLYQEYGPVTGMPDDSDHISRRMTGYYSFNSKRYQHAIAPGVPHAILEMGFLTNAADRQILFTRQSALAQGIVNGISRFLSLPSV